MFQKIHPATWLLVTLTILSMLDYACTYIIIEIGGGKEVNPIMNYVIQASGTIWGLLWVKVLMLGTIICLYVSNTEFKTKWQSQTMISVSCIVNLAYLSVVTYSYHIIWANDISW